MAGGDYLAIGRWRWPEGVLRRTLENKKTVLLRGIPNPEMDDERHARSL